MKIPTYIETALRQRAKCAAKLGKINDTIDTFLIKNGITEEVELFDYGYGAEVICSPYESADRVREAIKNHRPEKHK